MGATLKPDQEVAPIMALTDTKIRTAKHGAKPIKLFDERGLFLLLQPPGGKLWRLKYRINGKEKKLSLGTYPDVSLKAARQRRDDARALIANGIDPAQSKLDEAAAARVDAANTFKVVGNEFIEKCALEGRAAVTIKKTRWLFSLMEGDLGDRPVIVPHVSQRAFRLPVSVLVAAYSTMPSAGAFGARHLKQ